MQRVIETSMEHSQPSDSLWALVLECSSLDSETPDETCSICKERIVELAIRGEWAIVALLAERITLEEK